MFVFDPLSCEGVNHDSGLESLESVGFLRRQWLFSIGINGWWSVMTVKCCYPDRNSLHLEMAQLQHIYTASIYEIQCLWGNEILPGTSCLLQTQSQNLVGLHNLVDLVALKKNDMGATMRESLAASNVWSWSADQATSFLVLALSREQSGVSIVRLLNWY